MVRQKILIAAMLTICINGTTNAVEIYNNNNTKLDVYGEINGSHYFSPNVSLNDLSFDYRRNYFAFNFPPGEDNTGLDKSRANFGFRAESVLNDEDKILGYGELQYNVPLNAAENDIKSSGRGALGFIGIKSPLGSFDYGRNYGIMHDVSAWTNVLPEFGGDSEYSDNYLIGRNSGLFTYRNNDFFGLHKQLKFAIQYQSQSDDDVDKMNFNANTYGMSASYMLPIGVGISGAYGNSALVKNTKNNNLVNKDDNIDTALKPEFIAFNDKFNDNSKHWSTAIKYDKNNFYFATMYGKTYKSTYLKEKIDGHSIGFIDNVINFEMVAKYKFDFGLIPSIAYIESKIENTKGDDTYLYKYIDLGATYIFSKNMMAYCDYRINKRQSGYKFNFNGRDNILAIGLIYKF
ncbi:porin OmpC [Candidatus Pantoea edessiphila]|uniref:Porin OmpC n=1 Tax=Candidatus Pantoea edessiphila TaxID=2044610 RepID=A0A2P5T0I3_9GAMM|nr:porin [Candidatus Pantoea edessiphila]PPI88091.1 porin OmpC [Candidatus Pantoea edessiphila]